MTYSPLAWEPDINPTAIKVLYDVPFDNQPPNRISCHDGDDQIVAGWVCGTCECAVPAGEAIHMEFFRAACGYCASSYDITVEDAAIEHEEHHEYAEDGPCPHSMEKVSAGPHCPYCVDSDRDCLEPLESAYGTRLFIHCPCTTFNDERHYYNAENLNEPIGECTRIVCWMEQYRPVIQQIVRQWQDDSDVAGLVGCGFSATVTHGAGAER